MDDIGRGGDDADLLAHRHDQLVVDLQQVVLVLGALFSIWSRGVLSIDTKLMPSPSPLM